VFGPIEPLAVASTPQLKDAVGVITGWGSPRFDGELLKLAPKLQLLAHSAGSLRGVVSDAVAINLVSFPLLCIQMKDPSTVSIGNLSVIID
jgi:hypothetical protein